MLTLRRMFSSSSAGPHRLLPILMGLALVVLTVIPFWAVRDCGFINLDDNRYVYENARVLTGLNWENLKYAFSFDVSNWHPLTWLSWMLDYEIFGLNPSGYHLVNLLFHVINTLLLFWLLRRMTKSLWPGAFVAALFAVHPLHVESVAWIAERKDVLSGFFWILTIGAYTYYAERPGWRRYFGVVLLFVLGLMSKPMTVTLPFALMLLDYWPLGRLGASPAPYQWKTIRPLLWEKIPLLMLSVLSCVVTYLAQLPGGATQNSDTFSLGVRLGNALIAYVAYLGKMIWPASLAVLYPHPGQVAPLQVLGALGVLAGITAVVIWRARRSPYLVTGWFWYLGTLVPVIGIVQVGIQSMADRYSYIPLIGVFIMAAWGIPELLSRLPHRDKVLVPAAVAILLALCVLTHAQVGYWRSNLTLYDHTLEVTHGNWLIHNNRGNVHNAQGNYGLAIEDYNRAISIRPGYVDALANRGAAYSGMENYRQAIADFSEAIKLKPDYAEAYINRGSVYNALENYRQAVEDLNRGIAIKPGYAMAYFVRGIAHNGLGQSGQAVADFSRAIEIQPGYADAYVNRGLVHLSRRDNASGCADAYTACRLGNCRFWDGVRAEGHCR